MLSGTATALSIKLSYFQVGVAWSLDQSRDWDLKGRLQLWNSEKHLSVASEFTCNRDIEHIICWCWHLANDVDDMKTWKKSSRNIRGSDICFHHEPLFYIHYKLLCITRQEDTRKARIGNLQVKLFNLCHREKSLQRLEYIPVLFSWSDITAILSRHLQNKQNISDKLVFSSSIFKFRVEQLR